MNMPNNGNVFNLATDRPMDRDAHRVAASEPRVGITSAQPRFRILAVASGGGHWIQLMRMMPAFDRHEVVYVTTHASHRVHAGPGRFYVVPDGNRRTKIKLIKMAVRLLWIIVKERPEVVISTGAAPGYFAVRIAHFFGARTIWVDSIANAERLSMSGLRAGKFVDLWLTQWPHLARAGGPYFKGSVI
jgi:UDP-N-acetylglucosamine:LPS N-acetylglucosamine transferase